MNVGGIIGLAIQYSGHECNQVRVVPELLCSCSLFQLVSGYWLKIKGTWVQGRV